MTQNPRYSEPDEGPSPESGGGEKRVRKPPIVVPPLLPPPIPPPDQEPTPQYVRWDAQIDACVVCLGNADEGPQPLGHVFSGGYQSPPQHDRCRCMLISVESPQ